MPLTRPVGVGLGCATPEASRSIVGRCTGHAKFLNVSKPLVNVPMFRSNRNAGTGRPPRDVTVNFDRGQVDIGGEGCELRRLNFDGEDEPPSNYCDPIWNYTSQADFYPLPGLPAKGWLSLQKTQSCKVLPDGAAVDITVVDNGEGKEEHTVRVRFISSTAYELRFDPFAEKKGLYSSEDSYAAPPEIRGKPSVLKVTVKEANGVMTITAGRLKLDINKACFAIKTSTLNDDQSTYTVLSEDVAPSDNGAAYQFKLIGIDRTGENGSIKRKIGSVINFKKKAPGNQFYGFGQKAGLTLQKEGKSLTFFNYDNFGYDPKKSSQPLYISVPLLIEARPGNAKVAHAVFLDNPGQTYINTGRRHENQLFFGTKFGELKQFFFAAPLDSKAPLSGIKSVVSQYTGVTGRIPLPPVWALGYHQGCYGYKNDKLVQDVCQLYREKNLPCDGIHIDVDFASKYQSFTHDETAFPDVYEFFQMLHAKGFRFSTNIVAKITVSGQIPSEYKTLRDGILKDVFIQDSQAAGAWNNKPYYIGQQTYGNDRSGNLLISFGYYPDLTKAEVREWWGDQYKYLMDGAKPGAGNTGMGFDMIWQDMMCPAMVAAPMKTLPLWLRQWDFGKFSAHGEIHNAYGHTMLWGTYEGLQKINKEANSKAPLRPFIIARGGWAGSQRYAAFWTGDNNSTWDSYRMSVPMILNLGLSGMGITGADVGGYGNNYADVQKLPPGLPNGTCAPDLLARWMALGTFLPWYRNHYSGYTKPFQEPWCFGKEVESVCRRYIELRYQLQQVWYDLTYECHKTGVPMCRPLFLEFPEDKDAYGEWADTQFMVGNILMVAPVVEEGAQSRKVYLPKQKSGTRWHKIVEPTLMPGGLSPPLEGGQVVDVEAPVFPNADVLQTCPLFACEGAIVPHKAVQQYSGELMVNPKLMACFPAPEGTVSKYTMYEDDGLTEAYKGESAASRVTQIYLKHGGPKGRDTLDMYLTHNGYTPPEAFAEFRLLGQTSAPLEVLFNGKVIPATNGGDLSAATSTAYSFVPAPNGAINAASGVLFIKVFFDYVESANGPHAQVEVIR